MKKKMIMLFALFASVLGAYADNTLAVENATVTQGKTSSFCIDLINTDEITAGQFVLTLPAGLTFNSIEKTGRATGSHSVGSSTVGQDTQITFNSSSNELISGNSGALFTVTVDVDGGVELGDLTGTLSAIELTKKDESHFNPADVNFTITVSDRVVLDENSAAAPIAQSSVNVLVKRTLKKDVWNTICLPFAMPAAKVSSALGSVEIGDFIGFTAAGSVFTVNFATSSVMKANTPYIIKPSTDISEFTVDGVNIVENANPKKEYEDDELLEVTGIFYGTMKAGVVIPNNNLFIKDNKFYYSTGDTTIKGFRGYFWLSGFDSAAAPEINISVDGNTTKVDGIQVLTEDGAFYNLKGMKVENPTEKGVYIQNGKKVVVK